MRLEDSTEAAPASAHDASSRPAPTVSLQCRECEHVVVVGSTPHECPACGGTEWIRAAWHPFSALREFPGSR